MTLTNTLRRNMNYDDTKRIRPSEDALSTIRALIPARLVTEAVRTHGANGKARNITQAVSILDFIGESNLLALLGSDVAPDVIARVCKVSVGQFNTWLNMDDERVRKYRRVIHLGAAFDAAAFRKDLLGQTGRLNPDEGRLVKAQLQAASQIDDAVATTDPNKQRSGVSVTIDLGSAFSSMLPAETARVIEHDS